MRILMLGWEYPPHISGGLGTACEGLTTALARRGVEIDFLVPRLYGEEDAPHMQLLGAAGATPPPPTTNPIVRPVASEVRTSATAPLSSNGWTPEPSEDGTISVPVEAPATQGDGDEAPAEIRVVRVPAMLKPYLDQATYRELIKSGSIPQQKLTEIVAAAGVQELPGPPQTLPEELSAHVPGEELPFAGLEPVSQQGAHYGDDLFAEVARYAMSAAYRVNGRSYDLVHAHDWMTFPAGVEIARRVGAPLLVHVHSLEYDRAGQGADRDIVRLGATRARAREPSRCSQLLHAGADQPRTPNAARQDFRRPQRRIRARDGAGVHRAASNPRTRSSLPWTGHVPKGPRVFRAGRGPRAPACPGRGLRACGLGRHASAHAGDGRGPWNYGRVPVPGLAQGGGNRTRLLDRRCLRDAVGVRAFRHRSLSKR